MQPTATLTPVDPHADRGNPGDPALIEATHTLADEVREVLIECGFTTGEIDRWVDTYTRRAGTIDADAFLDWISTYEPSWATAMVAQERRSRR